MAKSSGQRKLSRKKDTARKRHRKTFAVFGAFLALALLAWLFVMQPEPEPDLAAWLEERGLSMNAGFAGHYLPGTVLRTHRPNDSGEPEALPRPEILLWPEDCFPNRIPKETELPLPQTSGERRTSWRLGGKKALDVLPSLGIDGAKSWQVEIEQPRLATFAEADLARQFSSDCLDRLEVIYDGGTDPAWTATILEAVLADGLSITVDWQTGLSTEARTQATQTTAKKLQGPKIKVKAEIGTEGTTVLHAQGPIVVAYRVAEMVAIE